MKIRWIRRYVWLLLLAGVGATAQEKPATDSLSPTKDSLVAKPVKEDLFDAAHSRRFADYLFRTGQYDYATEEYQRVAFLQPADAYPRIQIVKAQEGKKDYYRALGYFEMFFPYFDTLQVPYQKEAVKLYVLNGEYATARKRLWASRLDTVRKHTLDLGITLLEKKWKDGLEQYRRRENILRDPVFHQFGLVAQRRLEHRNKSPLLAAGLSAVVPGLGKVYTKDYGDAFMSFLFVGLNAWQAWRGFRKQGVRSVHGWIFAGFGVSFYLGNVWGSAKAAKRYNRKLDKAATDEVRAVFEYNL